VAKEEILTFLIPVLTKEGRGHRGEKKGTSPEKGKECGIWGRVERPILRLEGGKKKKK